MADVSRLSGFIRPIIYVGPWFINLIPASSEPPSSDSPPPPAAPFNSFCNMLGGVLLALAASMGLVDGMSLVPRQTQSQAICASSFQWMNNHAGDSPCIVASKLGGICNSGSAYHPFSLSDKGRSFNILVRLGYKIHCWSRWHCFISLSKPWHKQPDS